jgi:hypothetical protein
MKRLIVLFLVVSLALAGCADKLLAMKTAAAFIDIGASTAKSVIAEIVQTKRAECLKVGGEATLAFEKCFASTKKIADATDKIWPQLDKALDLVAAAIKEKRDAVELIKKSACLLADLANWIPEKHRKKIDKWLVLASAFACDKPSAKGVSPERTRELLVKLRVLLVELGAKG